MILSDIDYRLNDKYDAPTKEHCPFVYFHVHSVMSSLYCCVRLARKMSGLFRSNSTSNLAGMLILSYGNRMVKQTLGLVPQLNY